MRQNRLSWKDCIKNYRFHSIFFKNLILIVSIIMLPFLCILAISYYAYEHIYNSEEKAYTDEIKTMIVKDIESIFSETQENALLLSQNVDIKNFFLSSDDYILYDHDNIMSNIGIHKISSSLIDDIYFYSPSCQYTYSAAGRHHYSQLDDQECIDRWQNTEYLQQYEYLDRTFYRMRKENLCLYYTIQYSLEKRGVIIFQLNMNELRKTFDYGEHVNLIICGNQNIIYDSTNQWLGTHVSDIGEILQTLDDGIIITSKVEEYGIEIILHIDRVSLDEKLNTIAVFLIFFVVIMLIITIVLVFYLSQKIFTPFTEILNALEDSSGDEEKRLLQNKDEIEYIMDSITSTLSRNKDIEKELLERIRLLKKAQSVALQAQINPHFINNTLENINWKVIGQFGGENDISEMLNCLSSLMRISLGDSDTFVTLNEEIDYVKKYLFIQQKRLENKFDVEWKIAEGLEKCKIIRLVLQPVVENAINYGIKPYKKRGKIEIKAFNEENLIKIIVKDSGYGLTAQETEEINASIRRMEIKESNHIGLSNVNQRLILAFGEEYGVTISSMINVGTSVMLELPYILPEQH